MTNNYKKTGIIYEDVFVNPLIAQEYLTRNIKNRNVKQHLVSKYASDMAEGRWKANGECIKFDTDGNLIDGQHRLRAVIKSGMTILMTVARGVKEDAIPTIDLGSVRSVRDVFCIEDIPNANIVSTIVRRYIWLNSCKKYRSDSSTLSKPQVLEEYIKNPDIYKEAHNFGASIWRKMRLIKLTDVGAFYLYLVVTKKHDDASVRDFFVQLVDPRACECNAIHLLRERLIQNLTSRAKLTSKVKTILIIKAFNAYITGKKLLALRYSETIDENTWFL